MSPMTDETSYSQVLQLSWISHWLVLDKSLTCPWQDVNGLPTTNSNTLDLSLTDPRHVIDRSLRSYSQVLNMSFLLRSHCQDTWYKIQDPGHVTGRILTHYWQDSDKSLKSKLQQVSAYPIDLLASLIWSRGTTRIADLSWNHITYPGIHTKLYLND